MQTLIGRVERMKLRVEPAIHLLEAAKKLRRERDREKDLAMQKIQEAEAFEVLKVLHQKRWKSRFNL